MEVGTVNGERVFFAQAGSGTGLVCFGANDSPPERGTFAATGSPDSRGVIITATALSLSRYFLRPDSRPRP